MAEYIIFYMMGVVCSAVLWRLVTDLLETEWRTVWILFAFCFLSWIAVPVFLIALIVYGVREYKEEKERDRKKREQEYRLNWKYRTYKTPDSSVNKNRMGNARNVRVKSNSK